MKAGVMYGPRDIRFEEVDDLKLVGDYFDVLVKVGAAGICGSDMHRYVGTWTTPMDQPVVGHEIAGTVVEVAPNVTNLKVGDRVGIEPLNSCGVCPYCKMGSYHVCSELAHVGGKYSGGFAEYTKVNHNKAFILPDYVSFDEASTLDCYAVAVHAVKKVPVTIADTVVIFGAGAIGITLAQVSMAAGAAQVVVVDIVDSVLETAKKCGVKLTFNSAKGDLNEYVKSITNGLGADIAFEAVGGKAPTLQQATEVVRRLGTVGHVGMRESMEMGFWDAYGKELDIQMINSFSSWGPRPDYAIALQLMADKRINALPMITHRYGLADIKVGFESMVDKNATGAVKVVIQPNG